MPSRRRADDDSDDEGKASPSKRARRDADGSGSGSGESDAGGGGGSDGAGGSDDGGSGAENGGAGSRDIDDSSSESSDADRIGGKVEYRVRDFNKHLICPLCDGYFRDATTTSTCMHTFCKICIYRFFNAHEDNHVCPTCKTNLGVTPRKGVGNDRMLQGLVDLLMPEVAAKDAEERTKFHEEQASLARAGAANGGAGGGAGGAADSRAGSRAEVRRRRSDSMADGDGKKKKKKRRSAGEQLQVKLLPEAGAKSTAELSRPLWKTVTSVRIRHIRKRLMERLELPSDAELALTCGGKALNPNLQLKEVAELAPPSALTPAAEGEVPTLLVNYRRVR